MGVADGTHIIWIRANYLFVGSDRGLLWVLRTFQLGFWPVELPTAIPVMVV